MKGEVRYCGPEDLFTIRSNWEWAWVFRNTRPSLLLPWERRTSLCYHGNHFLPFWILEMSQCHVRSMSCWIISDISSLSAWLGSFIPSWYWAVWKPNKCGQKKKKKLKKSARARVFTEIPQIKEISGDQTNFAFFIAQNPRKQFRSTLFILRIFFLSSLPPSGVTMLLKQLFCHFSFTGMW